MLINWIIKLVKNFFGIKPTTTHLMVPLNYSSAPRLIITDARIIREPQYFPSHVKAGRGKISSRISLSVIPTSSNIFEDTPEFRLSLWGPLADNLIKHVNCSTRVSCLCEIGQHTIVRKINGITQIGNNGHPIHIRGYDFTVIPETLCLN